MVAKDMKYTNDEPQIFKKAWIYVNPESRRKWQATNQKEFDNMKKQKVWKNICKVLCL